MRTSTYCVLIPAYNVAESIGSLVRRVREQGLDVVVVDDGSSDDTQRIAEQSGAFVLRLTSNHGKGAALRAGFSHTVKVGYSGVVTMDGDGQHNPADLPRLLAAARRGDAKLIIGNRMKNAQSMPVIRRWTNQAMSQIVSSLIRQDIPDSQCGFRFIHREVLERISLMATHYDIESEILLAAGRGGWQVVSEPISTIYGNRNSHIRPVRDTWRFVKLVARHLLHR